MNFEGYEPQQHDEAPAPPEKAPSQAARFIFGMSDALAPRSGAIMVMRAMAAIWQRHDLPAWEVRACGGGPRFQEVLEEAENLGVQSRLCLLNEQDLPEMLRPCRAWIAPGSAPDETPETLGAGMAAGMNCLVLKGVTIGEGAIIGAGSVVTRDIPPFCLAAGSPARVLRRLDQGETADGPQPAARDA